MTKNVHPPKPPRDRTTTSESEPGGTPSQQGSGGGNMARKVGQRDELKTGESGDALPTSVDGRDKADDGDFPTTLQTRK